MIDAEYEELNEPDGELDLADTDSLPWLESDDEDDTSGGYDPAQIMLFCAAMVLLGSAVLAGVWFISNRTVGGDVVADGSVIEAPVGPIKEKPDNPGGKEFAGTGNVAPVVGEGGTRPAVVATAELPPLPDAVGPGAPAPSPSPSANKLVKAAGGVGSGSGRPATAPGAAAGANLSGVGVQLAAYGTRARAEQGWNEVTRRTDKLAGVKYRVVEGRVDSGTVFRLQAVTADRASADRLCAALKADGLDCQVKP